MLAWGVYYKNHEGDAKDFESLTALEAEAWLKTFFISEAERKEWSNFVRECEIYVQCHWPEGVYDADRLLKEVISYSSLEQRKSWLNVLKRAIQQNLDYKHSSALLNGNSYPPYNETYNPLDLFHEAIKKIYELDGVRD